MTEVEREIAFYEEVDAMLGLAATGSVRSDPAAERWRRVVPQGFRRALVMSSQASHLYPDDFGIWTDAKVSYLDETLDVSMARMTEPDTLMLRRMRALEPRLARGRVTRACRAYVEHSVLWLHPSGRKGSGHKEILGLSGNDTWSVVSPLTGQRRTGGGGDNARFTDYNIDILAHEGDIGIFAGTQFNLPYYWHVEIGSMDTFSLMLPTDALGARELFKLRDLSAESNRRTALRSWVREHTRKHRLHPELEVSVRRHLRGASAFTWGGLTCKLFPSREDLALNEQLAEVQKGKRHA